MVKLSKPFSLWPKLFCIERLGVLGERQQIVAPLKLFAYEKRLGMGTF